MGIVDIVLFRVENAPSRDPPGYLPTPTASVARCQPSNQDHNRYLVANSPGSSAFFIGYEKALISIIGNKGRCGAEL